MDAGTDAGYGIGIAPTQQGAGAVQLTSSGLSASDTSFLQRAAQYNQADIQLGQTIVQKSDSPALKTLGQRLVDDHTLANQQLQAIIAQTGATVPSAPNQEQQQMLDRLNGLNGPQFDQSATQDAIRLSHHQVNLYSQAANSAQTPEIKHYAERNLSVVQDELNQARSVSGPAPTFTPNGEQQQPQQ
jgi:putative membrane protein